MCGIKVYTLIYIHAYVLSYLTPRKVYKVAAWS